MTLKEIAARAGVSVATVSYVLNNSAKVGPETRERVERIIKETGYRSNILAQSLRKNKTCLVGVLVEDVTVWHTAFIIDGINELAEKMGYHTILSNLRLLSKIESQFEYISNYQDDIDKAVDVLLGMQVDGIIYVGMHDRAIHDVLHDINKPVVYSYCYTERGGSSVRYSNKNSEYLVTKKFLEYGHTEFGVIKGQESSEATVLRMAGIRKALEEAQIPLREENIVNGKWKYEQGKDAAKELLDRKDYPSAIIAMNDDMAVGARDAALELGLRVPEDVSIAGFDNADIVHYITPRITTVDRPLQEMGYQAMQLLLDKINDSSSEDVKITLPCKLVEGKSITEK